MDVPNDRSSQKIPTPRGGGLAIISSFLVGAFLVCLFIDQTILPGFLFLLVLGDLLGSVIPVNSDKIKKITHNLTFDDTKARINLNWHSNSVLDGWEMNNSRSFYVILINEICFHKQMERLVIHE